MTFKVEMLSVEGAKMLRLIGWVKKEHLEELTNLVAGAGANVKLDLAEVTLVDIDVVRFLRDSERSGVELVNCSPYIREWIRREGTAKRERCDNS